MNVTFFADNIDPRIPEMQKKVFEALGMTIHQVKPEKWEGHGGTIDGWLRGLDPINDREVIVLWDVDCIPLNADIVNMAVAFADRGGIMGVAQKASHIPDSMIYAGPAFLAFSMQTWRGLNRPTVACTERADCAGELSYRAREQGIEVRMLYPSHVEEPLWQLDGPIKFGKGTTFGSNDIYHAFYSRKRNANGFIKKCEEVLKQHAQSN